MGGTKTFGSVSGYATHTSLNSADFTIGCKNADNSKCDSVTGVTTKFPVSDTAYLNYTGITFHLELLRVLVFRSKLPHRKQALVPDACPHILSY